MLSLLILYYFSKKLLLSIYFFKYYLNNKLKYKTRIIRNMVLNDNYVVSGIQVKFKLTFDENVCHFHSTIIVKGRRFGWCGL